MVKLAGHYGLGDQEDRPDVETSHRVEILDRLRVDRRGPVGPRIVHDVERRLRADRPSRR